MSDKQDLSKSKWLVAAGVGGLLLGGWYYWSKNPDDDDDSENEGPRPTLGERRNIRPGTIDIPNSESNTNSDSNQGQEDDHETISTTITPTFPPPAYNFGTEEGQPKEKEYNALAKNKVIIRKISSYITPIEYGRFSRINKTWAGVMNDHEYWRENCRVIFKLNAVFSPKDSYINEHKRIMSYPTKSSIQQMMEQALQEESSMSRSEADLLLQVSKATQLFEKSYASLDYVILLLTRIGKQIALHESISPEQHHSLTSRILLSSGQFDKAEPYLTNSYEKGTLAKYSGNLKKIVYYSEQLIQEEPGFGKAYVAAQLLYPFFGNFDKEKARSLLFEQNPVAYDEQISIEQFKQMSDFAQVSILLGYTNGGLFSKNYAHALKLFNILIANAQNPVISNIIANFYNMYCHFGKEEVDVDALSETEKSSRLEKAIHYWKKAGSIPQLIRINLHQVIMGIDKPGEQDLDFLIHSIEDKDLRKLEFPEVPGYIAHLHLLKMHYWPSQHQTKEWFIETILTPLHYSSNSGCEVGHILLGNLYEVGCKFFDPNPVLAEYYYQRGLQFNSEACALYLVNLWWTHHERLHQFREAHPLKNTIANPPIPYIELTLTHSSLSAIKNLKELADAFFKLFIDRHGCCRTLLFAKSMYYGGFPSIPNRNGALAIYKALSQQYHYAPAAKLLQSAPSSTTL
mmetsp:Transcript_139/g.237  ORF Transcript_139/g.237 Transcript_139/m.237 type:complete len:685 (-) Transcript_139:621-2675(-)